MNGSREHTESLHGPQSHPVGVSLRDELFGGQQISDDSRIPVASCLAGNIHGFKVFWHGLYDRNSHPVHFRFSIKRKHVPPVECTEEKAFAFIVVQSLRLCRLGILPVLRDLLQCRIRIIDSQTESSPRIGDLHVPGDACKVGDEVYPLVAMSSLMTLALL